MNPYLTNAEIREFEEKLRWENIRESNIIIGKYLDFKPEISYSVSDGEGHCYSPDTNYFHSPESQKLECDRWLKEQSERFPEGWVTKGDYQTTKNEYYPQFHQDWNHLAEAIKRFKDKHIFKYKNSFIWVFSWGIFENWLNLLNHIKIENHKNP
jgi:hypothetical protein